jgi:ubiquinone biosynthesis protein Coq4
MLLKYLTIQRCKLLVLTHQFALPALKYVRKPKPFLYTKEQLHQLPNGSLGNDLIHFVEAKNLALLTHYARHDLKHIVLGYDTTEEGELCLQSFMLGNGRISIPVLATVFFGLLLAPEFWKKMYCSFLMGKQCNPIHQWDWFQMITQPTKEIQQKIFSLKKLI